MKPEEIKNLLLKKHWTLSTCESLTAGLVASTLGNVPGISSVFAGGLVTYMTKEKERLAHVSAKTLQTYGAVSKECAKEMASGAAKQLDTTLAVSTTGNAGPDIMEDKPVGLVYIGIHFSGISYAKEYHFSGTRTEIRQQATNAALEEIYKVISQNA